MTTSEVVYKGQLRTTAVHSRSNIEIITDAPVDNEGQGQSFSPTDMMATSLACCMLTVMGIKARKMNWNMDGTTATVVKTMASSPRKIAGIKVELTMPESLSEDSRAILEDIARNCPVALSIHPHLKQDVSFNYL